MIRMPCICASSRAFSETETLYGPLCIPLRLRWLIDQNFSFRRADVIGDVSIEIESVGIVSSMSTQSSPFPSQVHDVLLL